MALTGEAQYLLHLIKFKWSFHFLAQFQRWPFYLGYILSRKHMLTLFSVFNNNMFLTILVCSIRCGQFQMAGMGLTKEKVHDSDSHKF